MITVVIHPDFLAEKEYTIGVLLSEISGVPYRIETDLLASGYSFRMPNGKTIHIHDGFWSKMTQNEAYTTRLIPTDVKELWNLFDDSPLVVLFGNNSFQLEDDRILLDADLIAATFFMLTRWEEYAQREEGVLDQYGRFPGSAAVACRFGFIGRPVVNEWADFLFQCFVRLGWPAAERKKRRFQTVLSCDVDHPRLWWSKMEVLRSVGGAFFRGNPMAELQFMWKSWRPSKKDPFDTFEQFMDWGEQQNTPVQFNFLSERPKHFDAWYDLKRPEIRSLMQYIAERGHVVGFHPSREAAKDEVRFSAELSALRQVSPVPVVSGRHHYLCFDAPFTWQMWEKNGLEMDSTLGYPDVPGFRCGICVDYPVFDFLQKRTLSLREQPLMAMEVTFARYLQLDPENTLSNLLELRAQVQRFDGQFTLLWHNSSLNTWFWHPYRPVFEKMLL